jgi:hypothetical protein
MKVQLQASRFKNRPVVARRAPHVGPGRLRKVAFLGGAKTLKFAPWHDETWELWAHSSCRHLCQRDPDLLFDVHPEALWRNPKKKVWDPKYPKWLQTNRIPIMMQERYPDVPSSIRYPFETMITEFPRGYMANQVAYMAALALMEGVTHVGVFGCDYNTQSEYGPQRGSAEYWLGMLEGRGVHVLLPPLCDLLNRPHLLYGYESHPNGRRDKSYEFSIGTLNKDEKPSKGPEALVGADAKDAPKLRDIGVPPEPWTTEIAWA